VLESRSFKVIVENALLVSIDLCLVSDSKILLGKRNNEPLKGNWFTPGGRIHKNESWQHALLRIGEVEVGLRGILIEDFSLMGVWDHFYINSVFGKVISTHYVNLPHYTNFKFRPEITLDNQHGDFQ
jgi:colanic acid biosynthesis protein WcaH